MSQADAWMPLYIGDYLADTSHLTTTEHGAYLLLIMHYWRNGPLPDDDKKLSVITRLRSKEWTSDIAATVRAFFHAEDGLLHHKRIDDERAKALHNSSKRREAAQARWQQKACKPDANAYANASDVHEQKGSNAYDPRAPSPSPSPEDSVSLRSTVVRSPDDDPQFLAFWKIYPRKEAKPDAWKAWRAAVKTATAEEIIAGLRAYPFNADRTYWKLPAGWLRDRRWEGQSFSAPPTTEAARSRVDPWADVMNGINGHAHHQSAHLHDLELPSDEYSSHVLPTH